MRCVAVAVGEECRGYEESSAVAIRTHGGRRCGARTISVVVSIACHRHGGSPRGCADAATVMAPYDDLDVRERTRVDAHDV